MTSRTSHAISLSAETCLLRPNAVQPEFVQVHREVGPRAPVSLRCRQDPSKRCSRTAKRHALRPCQKYTSATHYAADLGLCRSTRRKSRRTASVDGLVARSIAGWEPALRRRAVALLVLLP